MRRIIGLILGVVLVAGTAQGQTFERGFLVTTAGDTLRGELENRFWQAPPEEVGFRPTAGAPVRVYPRRHVRAFRLESGRYFRAEVVPLDLAAQTNINSLPSSPVSRQQPDSLLAEVLVDGSVPLLRAVVGSVNHYFVQRPGQPYLEITERRYLSASDNGTRVVDANNYRSQLAVYLGDCPAAVQATGTAPFTARGLAGVVQAFRESCTTDKPLQNGLSAAVLPTGSLVTINVGLLAGPGYNTLRVVRSGAIGQELPLLDNVSLDSRLHPHVGVYLDALLPGRRWEGHTEAVLSTFGRRETFPLANGIGSYTWHGTKLDVRLGARRVLKKWDESAWFVGAGLNLNFTVNVVSSQQFGSGDTRLTADNVRVPTRAGFVDALAFAPGPYLESGLRWKRAAVSVDAGLTGNIDYVDPLKVNVAFRSPSSTQATSNYTGYKYNGTRVSYRIMLAYRLFSFNK